MNRNRARLLVLAAVAALVIPFAAGCLSSDDDGRRAGDPGSLLEGPKPPEVEAQQLAATPPGKLLPLRKGEDRMTLTMPESYTPSAPYGTGTDDYRCFLLDPQLDQDVWLTGSNVLPGNPDVVHHVILFKIPPDAVAEAEAKDKAAEDPGWTCFGGTGLSGEFQNLEDANWLAAWAPGGDETKTADGYGVELEAGSRIVMQVHYNLLKGAEPDESAAQLRWMPDDTDLTPLHTFLMPAPVELPCRADHSDGPLCDRDAAAVDVKKRFGSAGNTNTLLHLLCGTEIEPGETTTCTRTISRGMTVIGVAGHMHLLGRKISIEANPDTPEAKTLLRIPVWDFDNQGSKPIKPVHLDAGDTLRVTCQHQQWLRDKLPAFATQREDRYIMWAEGSTDEMCLGLLQVAFDDGL
jgi:copper type II ascorbate-dependent monooxygenase-like protein